MKETIFEWAKTETADGHGQRHCSTGSITAKSNFEPPGTNLRLVLDHCRCDGGIQQQLPCDGQFIHSLDHLTTAMLPKRGDCLIELRPQPPAPERRSAACWISGR
jgi:hypothetical protein